MLTITRRKGAPEGRAAQISCVYIEKYIEIRGACDQIALRSIVFLNIIYIDFHDKAKPNSL